MLWKKTPFSASWSPITRQFARSCDRKTQDNISSVKMHFTTLFALALPAIAAAQSTVTTTLVTASATNATTTTASSPTSTPLDYEAICESQAYGYAAKCPQCLSNCEYETTQTAAEQCYYSVFFEINYIESNCEAYGGGSGCETIAVNDVCTS